MWCADNQFRAVKNCNRIKWINDGKKLWHFAGFAYEMQKLRTIWLVRSIGRPARPVLCANKLSISKVWHPIDPESLGCDWLAHWTSYNGRYDIILLMLRRICTCAMYLYMPVKLNSSRAVSYSKGWCLSTATPDIPIQSMQTRRKWKRRAVCFSSDLPHCTMHMKIIWLSRSPTRLQSSILN